MARIVVLGGAESGVGAAVLAKVKGFYVFLSDKGTIKDEYAEMLRKWEIPFEQGQHSEELILNADEVVKSPGIPGTVPMVQKIREKGYQVYRQAANTLGYSDEELEELQNGGDKDGETPEVTLETGDSAQ